MTKITRLEDLKSRKKACELANVVYYISSKAPFAKDYELSRQIRRSAGSAMHNIAEGFDAGTNPEFMRFLKMARRFASEVQSQLYLTLDRGYITKTQLQTTYKLTTEVKKLINGLIGYLNKNT